MGWGILRIIAVTFNDNDISGWEIVWEIPLGNDVMVIYIIYQDHV